MQNRNKRRGYLVLCLEEVLLLLHENELNHLIHCVPILSTHEQLQMANFDKKRIFSVKKKTIRIV